MAKYDAQNITRAGWQNDATTWSEVQVLATVRAAERMEVAALKLGTIVDLLLGLGRDGIHDVIKEMARAARVKRKQRLARRRRARALKVAA